MKIKALVVDQRSVERNELTGPLKRIGVRKIVEVNVETLLAQPFRTGDFDAVFIEFNTLMEAGRGLTKSLREMDGQVPIIMTYPQSVSLADLQRYCPDASAYLMMPFATEQLLETVEQHVFEGAG